MVAFSRESALKRRPTPNSLQRLAPLFEPSSEKLLAGIVKSRNWTEYADYGTVRLGRTERPARLLSGRQHSVRVLAIPPVGGRYVVMFGSIDTPVSVRLATQSAIHAEAVAVPGTWARASVDLDYGDGASQSVSVDVDVAPGEVVAWGPEFLLPSAADSSRPNVVLVSLDTVRRDQLTPYSPTLSSTPALATFAREAMLFENAISTSSWTIASHATLFTGQYPADSLGYDSRVEAQETTLPEIFANEGYLTFGVSGGPYTDPHWGLHQGFDEYVVSGERENAHEATSRAIEWLDRIGKVPAFLFLNYFNAHEPLTLSPEVRARQNVNEDVSFDLWTDLSAARLPITSAVRQRLLRAYRAELSEIDIELRRLFEYLKRTGRWERSLVIVWSDHGQLLGERGDLGHAFTLEEELLRVPTILKPPIGRGLAPGVYSTPIQNDDLFAVIQTLAGLSNPEGASNVAMLNRQTTSRRLTFSKIHHDPLPLLTSQRRWRSATLWAVRDGATKIVRDLEGRFVAYDVTGEEEQITRMPAAGSPLRRALDHFRLTTDRVPIKPTVGPLPPEQMERLRALGYVR